MEYVCNCIIAVVAEAKKNIKGDAAESKCNLGYFYS